MRAPRVLIVEDDPASAKLLAVVLGGDGFSTQTAGSAEEALDALDVESPDVIILDLVLPLMSGLLLAKLVKARSTTRHIPIIAVSSFNGEQARRAALDAGCSDYVRKPIDATSFTQLVRPHLGDPR